MRKHLPMFAASLAIAFAACATQTPTPDPTPTPTPARDASGLPGPQVRSLTGATPAPPGEHGFSFLVGGHLYGNPGALSGVPSTTLLTQAHAIRNSPEQFLVSVGDFIRGCEPPVVVPTFEVLQFLEKPVFNAPGNHDYVPDAYEQLFGPSFGSFVHGNVLFVLLNTERQPWQFAPEQIDMVKATADWALRQPQIDHVCYFAHKVVFAVDEPRYASLLRNCNGRDGFEGTSNFATEVRPTLRRIAKHKRVLWFCGDLGVSWGFSLFYDARSDDGITYLGCGLGATESDCMLRVRVAGKELTVEPVPMATGAMVKTGIVIDKGVEHYGPAFWDQHFAKRARERLPKVGSGK